MQLADLMDDSRKLEQLRRPWPSRSQEPYRPDSSTPDIYCRQRNLHSDGRRGPWPIRTRLRASTRAIAKTPMNELLPSGVPIQMAPGGNSFSGKQEPGWMRADGNSIS